MRLYAVWRKDPDLHVKGCVGSLFKALMPQLLRLGCGDFVEGNLRVTMADIDRASRSPWTSDDHYLGDIVRYRHMRLVEWAELIPDEHDNLLHYVFVAPAADRVA